MPSSIISVLLVDDHAILRDGLRALLGQEPDITVIGEATDGREATRMAAELRPDVIIMDISMPNLNGLEAAQHILQERPGARIIMLSAHADDASIQKVLDSGAAGFLVKNTPRATLASAVREVHAGRSVFSQEIARRIQDGPRAGAESGKHTVRLTSREMEVLQLIAEGRANKQTADELGISIKTVEKHRQHLMEKLGIHDTATLTRYAIATGIVDSNLPGDAYRPSGSSMD